MAISKNLTLSNGLTISNAYIRIDTVSGYKGSLQISVNSYSSQQDFQNGKGYLDQKIYNFIPSVVDGSANFIKQGYEYLKTLDDYKDTTNVLEDNQTA